MANELRVRQNFLGGLVEDAPLTVSATTLTSAALAAMVAIGTTQHLPIVLDPDGIYGEPEIAYITAHTAAATTATILRAQEGSTARAHIQDVPWVHGPTVKDFAGETAWTPITLTSPWTAYTTGNYPPNVAYRKDGDGMVHLRGHVTSGTAASTILTLPAGYRPLYETAFACPAWNGTSWGAAQYAVDIQAAGTLIVLGPTPSATHVIGLDSVKFLADQ